MNIAHIVEEARRGRGEDRIAIVRGLDRTVFVVADGAGGCTGGAAAADTVCSALRTDINAYDWAAWLTKCDRALDVAGRGLAAAVVVSVSDAGDVSGASVGDCEAWLFGPNKPIELTTNQIRKPLLGSGLATPTRFYCHLSAGALVVASDGLWKYSDVQYSQKPYALQPDVLANSVRLQRGTLRDDVAVVVCEAT